MPSNLGLSRTNLNVPVAGGKIWSKLNRVIWACQCLLRLINLFELTAQLSQRSPAEPSQRSLAQLSSAQPKPVQPSPSAQPSPAQPNLFQLSPASPAQPCPAATRSRPLRKDGQRNKKYINPLEWTEARANSTSQVAHSAVRHSGSTRGSSSRPFWMYPNFTYQVAYHPVGHLMSTPVSPSDMFPGELQ